MTTQELKVPEHVEAGIELIKEFLTEIGYDIDGIVVDPVKARAYFGINRVDTGQFEYSAPFSFLNHVGRNPNVMNHPLIGENFQQPIINEEGHLVFQS
jgi:hypothetical protein